MTGAAVFSFSLPIEIGIALALAPLLPLLHVAALHLLPRAGRGRLLLGASLAMLACYVFGVLFQQGAWDFMRLQRLIAGLLALIGWLLAYVEALSLITRGYTLGLLSELHRRNRPTTEEDLAHGYAGGQGLEWAMRKRVDDLIALGLAREEAGMLHLVRPKGVRWAKVFAACISLIGFKQTG
ncbi:hypothetical protein [Ferrovibrio sp.]|uniref:hypothetical protein n=1 Tax=Ferrovibrio sp. TaxID=1917215 RepID=UPI003D2855A4